MSVLRTRCSSRAAERLGLVALVALAAALRLPGLERVPPGLHPDEAANAADALRGPWALRYAHEGGWVEGTYVWLAAPCLALAERLGASLEAALRLPAALAGIALVPAVALLGRRLAGRSGGLLAGLLVAVAPWAVHHARLGLRAALVAPLVAWGLVLLLRAEEAAGREREALLAGGLCALAAASYPPARLALPLLLLAWWLLARTRPLLLAAAPPLLVLVALLPWTLGQEGGQRLHDVLAVGQGQGPLGDAAAAARGWALHYGPHFLGSGASSRGFAPEGAGLLPRLTAPLLGLGLVTLCLRRDAWRPRLLLWLALAPLPAALTRDTPNALRAGPLLPALALLVALGAAALLRSAPPGATRRALRALLAGLILAQGLAGCARYARVHAVAEARFYDAGRRAAVLAAAAGPAGDRLLRCQDPFLGASLRLYAPGLPAARAPDGAWLLGPRAGEPGATPDEELLLLELAGPGLRARKGDRCLVPGVAWLRPCR